MSQTIFNTINPATTSGTQLASILVDFKNAMVSGMIGPSRPTELLAGGFWIDNAQEATPNFLWKFKIYTGSVDIEIFRVNISTNVASIAGSDSTFEIAKISADTAGPLLKLQKARIANSGQTLDGDTLGEIQFLGTTNGGAEPIVARLRVIASDDTTATANGGYLVIEGTTDAAAALQEWVRFVDGKMGIGTTLPQTTIHAVGSGIKSGRLADDAVGAKLITRKARITGTGATQNNDVMAQMDFNSTDDTTAEVTTAKIEVKATEAHTSTAQGTKVTISVVKTGAAALSEKVIIGSTDTEIKDGLTINAQTMGGQDIATAATIAALNADTLRVSFTGATDTEVQGISATGVSKTLLLHNRSTGKITLSHQNVGATANDRLKLPLSKNIVLLADQSVELFYSVADTRWKVKSGSGSGGGTLAAPTGNARATPQSVSAGTAIAVSTVDSRQIIFVEGNGGHVEMTANPQIAAPTDIYTEILLVGRNDDQTVTLPNGLGLVLNGPATLAANQTLSLVYDGTNYVETARSN